MELKQYQKRVLSDLDSFLRNLDELGNLPGAYIQTWLENGVAVGGDGMPPYQNTLPGVPHICFKVPTGGGKTYLGCSSLKHIYDGIEHLTGAPVQEKIVVWLVPSNAILEQTLRTLRTPDHPYRRQIDTDFNSRVEVLDGIQARNGQNFTPATVRENLTILVMSFDALRIKKKDGRKAYQDNGALESFVSTYEHPETMIPDAEINALMQVLNQKSPVVIIDESHNAQSDLSVEMLRNLNPSFVLDLTATPKKNSNIISIVDARELKKENMVKLPIIVYNRSSQTDVVNDAIMLRARLEKQAIAAYQNGGPYIRPIVLFQAQPKVGEDAATFQKLKELLVEGQIPEEQIAIKTSEINELKNVDLMSPACQIRYIITVNALKEGWDCPFAYVLATVANRSSQVDVEQIVGRILRLPYTKRHSEPNLNMSYVLTSSADFNRTVASVVQGLNEAGFTDRDCRTADIPAEEPVARSETVEPVNYLDMLQAETAHMESAAPENEFDIDVSALQVHHADDALPEAAAPASARIAEAADEMLRFAAQQNEHFEQEIAREEQQGFSPMGGDEMRHRYEMQTEYEEDASSLILPQFVRDSGATLFSDHEMRPVSRESLTEGFTLADKDIQINFEVSEYDVVKVDIDSSSRPRTAILAEREAQIFKNFMRTEPEEKKRSTLAHSIYNQLNRLDFIAASDLHKYVERVVDNMTADELERAEGALRFFADRIKQKILELVDEYREKQFYQLTEIGTIQVQPQWKFPKLITPMPTMVPLAKALYTDEAEVNRFEMKVIRYVSSLDNVLWWHRNIERRGFCLNGCINHYPDFIIRTTSGNIILLETKGDDRDNSDSRRKLRLGKKWAEMAGREYRYYMVFDENDTGFEGAYRFDSFMSLLKQL